MLDKPTYPEFALPGGRNIELGVFIALLVAGSVFITSVSEAATEKDYQTTASSSLSDGEPELLPQPPEEFPGKAVPAPLRNPAAIQQTASAPLNSVLDVTLESLEEVEIKTVLDAHQVILYSWSTSEEVYYDFHAEPAVGPEGYFVRYAEGEATSDSGSLVAPFTGHHGWYWLNISEKPLTIRLQVDGYHKEVLEVFRGKQ